ncbi:hypothetical protein [Azospirillum largimobile]
MPFSFTRFTDLQDCENGSLQTDLFTNKGLLQRTQGRFNS